MSPLQATPIALAINNSRASIPNIIIGNSGDLRFDLYSGPFTKNDQLTSAPFTDQYVYIPNVAFSVASQVLPALNNQGAEEKRGLLEERKRWLYERGDVAERYNAWLDAMANSKGVQEKRATTENLTLGYVTTDVRISSCVY